MGKLTLILGGARSGKSAQGLQRARAYERVAFIATAEAGDAEMRKRISAHKKQRPSHWKTVEAPLLPVEVLRELIERYDCIIIDCLTLLISNLQLKGTGRPAVTSRIRAITGMVRKGKAEVIIISNETGLGIVPANGPARAFRDTAGRVNQVAAQAADEVVFMLSGIPLVIKGASTVFNPPG
ncbi:MAG: bifunctional adenosylcobinamide kinase/adenosylcobinamide-phosphate guanylyltransferase [Candidatus Omnitrophica bacterium]|nr:bifunctional adenosylcobinamide kinase/adenosylcobinamide-phosphate guanylyltransferase [Candidatus Omnitrophota bacterium]